MLTKLRTLLKPFLHSRFVTVVFPVDSKMTPNDVNFENILQPILRTDLKNKEISNLKVTTRNSKPKTQSLLSCTSIVTIMCRNDELSSTMN